jgi:signal transduction protein with GAF and PtsI domain
MEPKEKCYYEALYNVAKAVSSSLDLQQVLDSVVTAAAWAVGAKACIVRLIAHDRDELLATAAHGLSHEYLQKGSVGLSKSGTDREVMTTGKPVHVLDIATDPRVQYPDESKKEGLASALVLPLMVEGKSIGVMRYYTRFPREFDVDEVEFLSAVASLSALAIENARVHQALRTDYEALTAWFKQ